MKVKIRKGDQVEVISGTINDKGKRGEVIKVLPDENRVVIQGVNTRTKHQRRSNHRVAQSTRASSVLKPLSAFPTWQSCAKNVINLRALAWYAKAIKQSVNARNAAH